MKRIFTYMTSLLIASATVTAQDSYLNNYMVSTTDVMGTARFVGTGGALSALCPDISAIGSNPAAIAMMRRSTFSFTLGGIRQADTNTEGESVSRGSFDQIGCIISCPIGDDSGFSNLNIAFNYQKKNDLTHNFIADNTGGTMLGFLDGMYAAYPNATSISPVFETAVNSGLIQFDDGQLYFTGENGYYDGNGFMRTIEGAMHGFDINISTNYSSRFYFGLTLGLDYLRYKSHGMYDEYYTTSALLPMMYSFNNRQKIHGWGYNVKLGAIFRPIENSGFRVGLAIETPTWYKLSFDGECEFDTGYGYSHCFSAFNNGFTYGSSFPYDYNLTTPWRFRLSLGHTIGTFLALGAEYEYADYGSVSMAYPDYDDYGYYDTSSDKDKSMNLQTSDNMQGVHSIKLGCEVKPIKQLALRAGYNYYTSSCHTSKFRDSRIDSPAEEFGTYTDFMQLGDVHIGTFGIGYVGNRFYADFAYKYRAQKADFYPYFCDSDYAPFLNESEVAYQSHSTLNLDRHQVMFTLGWKF